MLFLIGLGLSEKDITVGSIEAFRTSELYVDRFTSYISDRTMTYISETAGKQVAELTRQDMEEDVAELVKRAATRDIAVLVGGDPLMATTHKILYIEAKHQGVQTHILHANSIITTVIGESGLDFYRFGSVCTIPKWSEHYKPMSFYEKIERNLTNNEHTILLLDYDSKRMETLPVGEAIGTLEKADAHYKKGIITDRTKIIIMHNISQRDGKVMETTVAEAKSSNLNGMNVIIMPAALSDVEKDAVQARTGAKW